MGYTCVLLNEGSRIRLENICNIPEGWEVLCHHMTINMGLPKKGPVVNRISEPVQLRPIAIAKDDKVMAVKVLTDVPSKNDIKHVTVAVNRKAGGKPAQSNDLTGWQKMEDTNGITNLLYGVIQYVE